MSWYPSFGGDGSGDGKLDVLDDEKKVRVYSYGENNAPVKLPLSMALMRTENFSMAHTFLNQYTNCKIEVGNNIIDYSFLFHDLQNYNYPITIPNQVVCMDYMLKNCINFNQNIIIPENVESIMGLFYGCNNFNANFEIHSKKLKDLSFLFDNSSITKIPSFTIESVSNKFILNKVFSGSQYLKGGTNINIIFHGNDIEAYDTYFPGSEDGLAVYNLYSKNSIILGNTIFYAYQYGIQEINIESNYLFLNTTQLISYNQQRLANDQTYLKHIKLKCNYLSSKGIFYGFNPWFYNQNVIRNNKKIDIETNILSASGLFRKVWHPYSTYTNNDRQSLNINNYNLNYNIIDYNDTSYMFSDIYGLWTPLYMNNIDTVCSIYNNAIEKRDNANRASMFQSTDILYYNFNLEGNNVNYSNMFYTGNMNGGKINVYGNDLNLFGFIRSGRLIGTNVNIFGNNIDLRGLLQNTDGYYYSASVNSDYININGNNIIIGDKYNVQSFMGRSEETNKYGSREIFFHNTVFNICGSNINLDSWFRSWNISGSNNIYLHNVGIMINGYDIDCSNMLNNQSYFPLAFLSVIGNNINCSNLFNNSRYYSITQASNSRTDRDWYNTYGYFRVENSNLSNLFNNYIITLNTTYNNFINITGNNLNLSNAFCYLIVNNLKANNIKISGDNLNMSNIFNSSRHYYSTDPMIYINTNNSNLSNFIKISSLSFNNITITGNNLNCTHMINIIQGSFTTNYKIILSGNQYIYNNLFAPGINQSMPNKNFIIKFNGNIEGENKAGMLEWIVTRQYYLGSNSSAVGNLIIECKNPNEFISYNLFNKNDSTIPTWTKIDANNYRINIPNVYYSNVYVNKII